MLLAVRRTLQSSAPGRGKDPPPTIPLLKIKEPTQQKRRFQKTPPVPVQWSKHPRNRARDDIKRKLPKAEDSRFLAHRGAVKPGRYKVVVEMNTYRRSPWDGDPVQALKNNDSKTKKKADNNTKSLDTLKRPASKSIGCSIVQLGVSLFASLYYLCI